ncbi:MAG: hypothetical protein JST08_06570 [Actinobacteria bacterium]|nr:hypothetical protein [Actinomycetota bacterium]
MWAGQESWGHLVCEFTGLPVVGHPKKKRASFAANASDAPSIFVAPKHTLSFLATQFYRHAAPADRRVLYTAELADKAGRITIHRKVKVAAPERSLLFPGGRAMPEEIAVAPPAPFTGSGEFLRTRESTFTWHGDLAVTFPGLDPIRLTGPRFTVVICALKGCVTRSSEADTPGF